MIDLLSKPWPWFIAGPAIGLTVALLLIVGGKSFGVSSSLRHLCAAAAQFSGAAAAQFSGAAVPVGRPRFLRYDWRGLGLWNLLFVAGIVLGGFIAGTWLSSGQPVDISPATVAELEALGVEHGPGLVPESLYSFDALGTSTGWWILIGGGFLVGFGARWAGGCTSGHAITGLANLQLPSLVAVVGFFVGGLVATHFVLPLLLGGGS